MEILTTEDYENIWLRIKDRFIKKFIFWLLVCFTVAGTSGAMLGYSIATHLIGPEIKSYIQSNDFKENVINEFISQLPAVEKRLQEADVKVQETLSKLSAIEDLPLVIEPGLISLVNTSGGRVLIQYGSGISREFEFIKEFQEPPVVLISEEQPFPNQVQINISSVSKNGFTVTLPSIGQKIQWLAIGK